LTQKRYTKEDEEDMVEKDVSNLWLHEGRYRIPISRATAGSWVLIEGVDSSIMKTATIVDEGNDDAYVSTKVNCVNTYSSLCFMLQFLDI
jgi:hypothetical protein